MTDPKEGQGDPMEGQGHLSFIREAHYFRLEIKDIKEKVRDLWRRVRRAHARDSRAPDYPEQEFDQRENLNLAYRRLEEAKMRLGKFIQAREGGVSSNQAKDESNAG